MNSRPQWVRELIRLGTSRRGASPKRLRTRLLDDAVPSAIRLQERAGVDFISDGEWRRESYVKVFTDAVVGFTNDIVPTLGTPSFNAPRYPAVTSRMSYRRPIASGEAEFLRARTVSKIIVAVPSPYTVGRRMWSADHSTAVRTPPARSSSTPASRSSTMRSNASPPSAWTRSNSTIPG